MFTLLVTPRHKNIKNWALPDPPELIICMRGFFDMAKKDFDGPGAVGATKKLKKSTRLLKSCLPSYPVTWLHLPGNAPVRFEYAAPSLRPQAKGLKPKALSQRA